MDDLSGSWEVTEADMNDPALLAELASLTKSSHVIGEAGSKHVVKGFRKVNNQFGFASWFVGPAKPIDVVWPGQTIESINFNNQLASSDQSTRLIGEAGSGQLILLGQLS